MLCLSGFELYSRWVPLKRLIGCLQSVGKIPHVHFTDGVILAAYGCIEEDNFDCKLPALPLLIGTFVANSIDRILLKPVSSRYSFSSSVSFAV